MISQFKAVNVACSVQLKISIKKREKMLAVHGNSIGRKKEEEKKKGVMAVYGGSVGRGQLLVNLLHFMNIIVNIFF